MHFANRGCSSAVLWQPVRNAMPRYPRRAELLLPTILGLPVSNRRPAQFALCQCGRAAATRARPGCNRQWWTQCPPRIHHHPKSRAHRQILIAHGRQRWGSHGQTNWHWARPHPTPLCLRKPSALDAPKGARGNASPQNFVRLLLQSPCVHVEAR